MQNHIIKTQVMEIHVQSEKDTFELQNKVSMLCHDKLIPVLARVMSSLSPADRVYRINRLELDMVTIPESLPEDIFLAKVEESLYNGLTAEIGKSRGEETLQQESRTPAKQEHEDMDLPPLSEDDFYPYEGEVEGEGIFSPEAAEVFRHLTKEKETEQQERKTDDEEKSQTDHELLAFFLETGTLLWWAEKGKKNVTANALELLIQKDPHYLVQLIENALMSDSGMNRLIMQFPDRLLEKITEILLPDTGRLAVVLYRDIRTITPPGLRTEIWRGLFLHIVAQRQGMTDHEHMAEKLLMHMGARHRSFFEDALKSIKEKSVPLLTDELFFLIKRLSDRAPQFLDKEVSEPIKDDLLPEIPRVGKGEFNDAESLYIDNAGLVLLSPFLPDFFTKIELVKDDTFISRNAALRAVLLLQYLVEGAYEFPEYMLLLNKIICGIGLATPVEMHLEITEKEDRECTTLLKKMILMYPRLGEMSVHEFRDVFLQREGAITIRDRTWFVRVTSEGRDILLGEQFSAPESVFLPWMHYPLFVEWI